MKKTIIFLYFTLINNFCYSQILIPKNEISILNSDTLVWLDKYESLLLCNSKGKRVCILSIETKYVFNIDTIQFSIKESKDSGEITKPQLLLNSEYCSFIDLDPFNCYFYIFKRHKRNFFSKSQWELIGTKILPPTKSGLSRFFPSPDINIIENSYLIDVFTSLSTYTNEKEEIHTYDKLSKTFSTKSNKILKE